MKSLPSHLPLTIEPLFIRDLERAIACPITIIRRDNHIPEDSHTTFIPTLETIVVFHTEHGAFKWRVKGDLESIFDAVKWFGICQINGSFPHD